MSSEPDYNFNQPAAANSDSASILLPFALITAAIAVMFVAQTVNTFKAHSSLHDGQVKLTAAYTQREALVKSSEDLQQKLQNLVLDLILLSKTDSDAKQIVSKYNIQQSGTPSAPAESTPAAAPK